MPILNRRVKYALRPFIPAWLRHAVLNRQSQHERYRSGTPADIFSAIYRDGIWGSGDDFMSGAGSHDPALVEPYINAVRAFAQASGEQLVAVDLGCGDFAVGKHLVSSFAAYKACDVVPALIERNRAKFTEPALSFAVVDLIADSLPSGDVAMLRQVLQHLSNDQVAQILPKLAAYKYVIVTEHIPNGDFTPNLDKIAGPHTRLASCSGLVLNSDPFHFERHGKVICRIADRGSIIETTVWYAM
jgi:hypothetical protein